MVHPSSRSGRTDEELALEARAGSRRSFEELALRYKRRLFVYLRARLGSDQDAEDMVQDTFLRLFRNIGSYDPAFRFSTWLYTSANRLAISSFRKKRARGARVDPDGIPGGAPAGVESEDALGGLWEAARMLGQRQFRVLWLRYGEGMTVAEIAASLSKSPLAVRLVLHRARTNLMKRYRPGQAPVAAAPGPRAAGETTIG